MYFTPGFSAGSSRERAPPTVELVARHAAAAARERVVDDEPDLDERRAALGVACPTRGARNRSGAPSTPEKVEKIGIVVCSGRT